jgi:hypothetical protein
MFGLLLGFGASGAAVAFLAILGILLFASVGWTIRRPADAHWLPKWLVLGFAVKLAGTFARFYMVTAFYGAGDSFSYYSVGLDMAAVWRSGSIPGLSGRGSLGTQVVESITGGMFAVFTPDMLGGFLMFAILAFFGQILLYLAFRRWARPSQLKAYAILIFLLPTYAFWPSSIGKDAIVLLGLGASAYFVARALQAFQVRWLFGLGASLAAIGFVRIHIAGLVVAAFAAAALFAKTPRDATGAIGLRRILVLGAGIVGAAAVLTFFPDILGVDLTSSQDIDGFTSDVVRRTSERGTIASGGPVTNPLDIPGAIVHVLYRPFLFEASEIQHLFAAAETTFLLGLTIWKLPAVWRNRREWRANAYVVYSTFYVLFGAVAFSVVRNLGIIARQRGQVLAFFLVVLMGLGWKKQEEEVSSPLGGYVPSTTGSYGR